MKNTTFSFTKLCLIALLLPLLLCACSAAPQQYEDDWLFSLKFQEMTPEELHQTLLDHGWVQYEAPPGSHSECYVDTLFGTKAAIYRAENAVNPETGLVTALCACSIQYPPNMEDLAQERLSSVEDGVYDKLRAAQPRPGTASEAAAAWATAVRESLARTGAVLSENGTTLPGGADTSQQALQEELVLYLDSGALFTDAREEGVYRFPDGRLMLLYLYAMPQEDGTSGAVWLNLLLLTEDYRTVDGAVLALPGT